MARQVEALGFVWNTLEHAWEKGFDHLKIYHAREGDCLVPSTHKEDGFRLGGWVGKQRSAKFNGKLSAERENRLKQLGFMWTTRARPKTK